MRRNQEYVDEPLPLEGTTAVPTPPTLPGPTGNGGGVCELCHRPASWHDFTLRSGQVVVRCERNGTQTRSFKRAVVMACASRVGIDTERARY